MPSPQQEKLLELLAQESAAIGASTLAEKAGMKTTTVFSQLTRLEKTGHVGRDTEGNWSLTDTGKEYVTKPSEIELGATEYDFFKYLGKKIGVPGDLIDITVEHVWNGGDYKDIAWVWKALGEMGIRDDVARRWWNSWRSHLGKGIPPELRSELGTKEGAGASPTSPEGATKDTKGEEKGGRDYIIADEMPLYVGEGLGDFSLKDAKDIISMRALRARVAATGGGQGLTMSDIRELIDLLRPEGPPPSPPAKSYIAKETEEGVVLQEVEPGKPIVVGGGKRTPIYYIDAQGNLQEATPGKPIVMKPAETPRPAKTVLINPDGTTTEYEAGKPIIIQMKPPGAGSSGIPGLPFPVFDAEGKPVMDQSGRPIYTNIEPMMKWYGFVSDERRKDERHVKLMGLVETVRENIGDGIEAIKLAAEEARAKKGGLGAAAGDNTPQTGAAQQFQCGECKTVFALPANAGDDWSSIKCPTCQHAYTRAEVLGQ